MVSKNIEVPNLGESIEEAIIVRWLAQDNGHVQKDEVILELESDKANVEIHSPETGVLHIKASVGSTVRVGQQVGEIESIAEGTVLDIKTASGKINESSTFPEKKFISGVNQKETLSDSQWSEEISPLVKAMSKRLLKGQQEAVPTTTYNDVDMSKIIAIRERRKTEFKEKYGVKLGLMSFFCDAVISGLKEFPILNARMNENEIIYNKKVHLGIAVTRERGLVVPVINNSDEMSYAELEQTIAEKANKTAKGNLDLTELMGGTFTITNGGVFGSLFSIPLLNPPQVGILGMHRIDYRPVAVKNGSEGLKLEIKPMMYVALTYDHRLIDGKMAIQFLGRIKTTLENADEARLFLDRVRAA
ncbi:MAG: 2-oxo acid dehydrogenase subunit E2 [Bdellovibrio sp.]|nr:2-oxo acid dehydrogenase subunit E2 [Bdellovibrio sp.]